MELIIYPLVIHCSTLDEGSSPLQHEPSLLYEFPVAGVFRIHLIRTRQSLARERKSHVDVERVGVFEGWTRIMKRPEVRDRIYVTQSDREQLHRRLCDV